jgi:iron complex outermembrane receptor protein
MVEEIERARRLLVTASLCLGASLWPLTAPAPAAAQPPVGAQEGGDEERDGEPVATRDEEIFVADSLPYVPETNTIATKLSVPLAWTPANVGLVGSALIDEQDAVVLGDALKNVSGMNVQTGNGVFDFFVVRGFDSISSGLILTDGAPEPETSFYQLYNAERVEVLKGPAGFLYGPNPLAAAVNIVRKQPVPADFATVGGSFGSFNTSEGTVDVNRVSGSGAVALRLNGLWRQSDGYRDRRDGEAWAVNPALTWQLGEASRLNLNLEAAASDYRPDAGLPIVGGAVAGVARKRQYGAPSDRSEQDLFRFQADFETRLADGVELRNKLYLRQLDWVSDGTLLLGVFPSPFGQLVGRAQLQLDDDQQFVGNQLEVTWSATTGAVEHRLLTGLELGRITDRFTIDTGLLDPISLTSPVETSPQPTLVLPLQAGDSESTVVAPYVIDQMTFSPRFQLLAGARYDAIDFDDQITGTARSDGELSPILGVVFSPTEGLALYANVARSFAPPSPRVVGEQRPEQSQQLEVGLRKELLGGRVRTTFALYQIERDNIAIPDDNGFTQQTGDQRARGAELEIVAEPWRGVTALLAYAYTDSELTRFAEAVQVGPGPGDIVVFDRSGNTSAFAPQHLANLWVSRRFTGGLGLGGGARWVDEQFIAEDNATALDGYVLFDAAVTYTFGDWHLALNLKNLSDQDYETRGFGSTSVIPGDPLAATLSFNYRL